MKNPISSFINIHFVLSLVGCGLLVESCTEKEKLCEKTEIVQEPTEEQLWRFTYFDGKQDTFQRWEKG